jgi:glycerol-3-phosphate acyltransferase PlsY
MIPNLSLALAIAAAYLAGSIPVGLVIAKLVRGVDLRSAGSGNIGATNVGRVLGRKWGVLCLVCDLLKGVAGTLFPLAVGLPRDWISPAMVACGAAAVLGHVFPVWLGFRGGKGVATGAGVAMVLSWQAALAAALAFAVVFAAKRIVSLSSMVAAVVYAAAVLVMHHDLHSRENWPLDLFAIAIPALFVLRHRDNIGRLLRGEAQRFSAAQTRNDSQDVPASRSND